MHFDFDFAISFSEPYRPMAKELADQLDVRGAAVFYDDSYRAHLLGKRLDHEFELADSRASDSFLRAKRVAAS